MTVGELVEILKTFYSDLEVKFISTEDGMEQLSIQKISYNDEDGGPLIM